MRFLLIQMRLQTVGLAVLVLALAVHDSSPHPHGRQEGRGRQGEGSGRRLYQEGDPKLCLLTNTTDQRALCTLQGCPEDTDCVRFSSPSSNLQAFYGYQDLEVRLCLKVCWKSNIYAIVFCTKRLVIKYREGRYRMGKSRVRTFPCP